jgi:hypothetical protein
MEETGKREEGDLDQEWKFNMLQACTNDKQQLSVFDARKPNNRHTHNLIRSFIIDCW